MTKNSCTDFSLEEQRHSWEIWNSETRERRLSAISERQATVVDQHVRSLHRPGLRILDVGCGTGWLSERLIGLGDVTGTDLCENVLARASARAPAVKFIGGDFMTVPLPLAHFDVVVTLEALSHFSDQPGFVSRLASLLRVGGQLILATQNRSVFERWSEVEGPLPGQIRRWVDRRTLESLLLPHFSGVRVFSICPVGDQGLLRLINSPKLNNLLSVVLSPMSISHIKERAMLGHTLMAIAERADDASS